MVADANRRSERRTLVRRAMLPRVWSLRDIEDVELLCRGVIVELAGRHGRGHGQSFVTFESADFYEALCFLLGEVVIQERQFDERPGIQFRPWIYNRLRFRLIDFWRSFYGRQGQHRVVDERAGGGSGASPGAENDWNSLDDGDARGDRRGGADLDPWADPAGGAAALGGLVAERDRAPAGAVGIVGVAARRGAEGSDAGGDGPARGRASRTGRPVAPQPFVDCGSCGWRTYFQAPNGVTRWHVPDWCSGCGAALGLQEAEA